MGASFSFSVIWSLYSAAIGQAIPSAIGHYLSAATAYIRNFEQSINDAKEQYNVPGIVASLVIDREITYCTGFGVTEIGDFGLPITGDAIFSIMSIAKSFTATAIMQLVENMKISLDEPVSNYLPYFHVQDEKYIKNPGSKPKSVLDEII